MPCKVLLTGFVRMIHRAGKPEFLGLARIEEIAEEIVRGSPSNVQASVHTRSHDRISVLAPSLLI
jgi:hypothetical protein